VTFVVDLQRGLVYKYTLEWKHNAKREATEEGCEGNRGRDGGRETLILSFVGILVKLG
jgi:hypothetical protein